MLQTKVEEKIKTHILCSIAGFYIVTVYEVMWKNIAEPDRPQVTWRMRIAWWLHKATSKHTKYVMLTDFPLEQWLH